MTPIEKYFVWLESFNTKRSVALQVTAQRFGIPVARAFALLHNVRNRP